MQGYGSMEGGIGGMKEELEI